MSLPRVFRHLVVFAAAVALGVAASARERWLLDFGWRFHLGNPWGQAFSFAKAGSGYGPASFAYSDASWRRVDLPHDWAVELPFNPKADSEHGFKEIGTGFPDTSVGWYRRTFTLPKSDAGQRISIEFEGVFRDATVFVNGWYVGHHASGYSPFTYDITDLVHCGGKNVIAVKVDASAFEGWWYEGAGLYRHVWLVKTAPLHLAPEGIYVASTFDDPSRAKLHLEARVQNAALQADAAVVRWQVLDAGGRVVAQVEQSTSVGAAADSEVVAAAELDHPALWSPESPMLYRLLTTLTRGDATIDRIETEFGMRTVAFDPDRGFLLNGRPYVLKGTCNHQDHAGVGVALPDALQYFRVARLKEMGCNAYRTAHNPPTAALLEACDRLGMLVMDESRLLGSDAENLGRWEQLIRRDRNHPSVAMWSIANEEFAVHKTETAARVAATMQATAHRLDPVRPVVYPAPEGNVYEGINRVIQVRGWNYHLDAAEMEAYHRAHPQQPNVGSEQASTVTTRGIYADDAVRGYVSAYDDRAMPGTNTAEQWWRVFAPRPWLSGGFAWTGFDYRGEPSPYTWPCISSHFGILDTCGFPKDNFWYYRSWWQAEPVVHLLPHWNWATHEGEPIDVRVFSNCDEVELSLNGQVIGRQAMKPNSHLGWKVPYATGTLVAKGYCVGKLIAQDERQTTGAPARLTLQAVRTQLAADGEDLGIVTVAVADGVGRVVPTAHNEVQFALEGPGRLIGVGNGDPSSHEADTFVSAPSVQWRACGDWRYASGYNFNDATPPQIAAQYDDRAWTAADVTAEAGPMQKYQHCVYRGRITVSADDLQAEAIELYFGQIVGDGNVFINGRLVGANGDAGFPSIYSVKDFLHVGENTVAVTLAVWVPHGGLAKGVSLRFIGPPAPTRWHRSVFNGLGQVLIRTARAPGELKLTATSPGLEPATLILHTKPAPTEHVME